MRSRRAQVAAQRNEQLERFCLVLSAGQDAAYRVVGDVVGARDLGQRRAGGSPDNCLMMSVYRQAGSVGTRSPTQA